MATSIIGFSVETYLRFGPDMGFNGKNIVPLEDMTPRQRYETACDDFEDCVVYDDVKTFLSELNDELICSENYFFYEYSE